jgi:ionotropic glutamate receptor
MQAFQKGSQLAIDISTAILKLNDDGTLQCIRDKYLGNSTCESSDDISSHLGTPAFLGLFLISGLVSTLAIISYCVKLARVFCVAQKEGSTNMESHGRGLSKCASIMCSVKSFLNFFTNKEIPQHKRKETQRECKTQRRQK